MATAEGVFPKEGNDPIFNSEYSGFFDRTKLLLPIDETTDLNMSNGGLGSKVYSFNGGSINAGSFLQIEVNGRFTATSTASAASANVSIFMGRSGTSFTPDILSKTIVVAVPATSSADHVDDGATIFKQYHTISPDDFSSGLDLVIGISGNSVAGNAGNSYTNRQVVFKLIQ